MNFLIIRILYFFELMYNFIFTRIEGIFDKNEKKIIKKTIYKYIPFNILIYSIDTNKYDYFLSLNNRYLYNKDKLSISPPIIKIMLKTNDNDFDCTEIDCTKIFNRYQNTFPLWCVIQNENFDFFDKICVKKQSILSEETIEVNIKDNIERKLSEIYSL